MGRTRCSARGYGAGDPNVSSGRAGGAFFWHRTGWAWASSGFGNSDQRGVSRGGRSEAVSRAGCAGTSTLAGEETLYRKRVRVWGVDVRGREMDGQAEYWRAKRRSRRVLCAVRDGRIAASALARLGELDRGAGRPIHILQPGRFDRACEAG